LNTRFRTLANNEFEKNLYKLMNNAVFGKTMENVRDHVDVRLITRWDGRYGAEAMIAKPNFHSRSIFSENLISVGLRKLEVKMNKPIYIGMCILEIAKLRLYEFHYEYMIPLYRDTCKILYTDTDSLIYLLECENVYEDIKCDIARFDTSDYPERNAYDIPSVNNKIPGLMKDENCGAIMTEFIGLRAKMYALRVIGKSDTKRIKGVKKNDHFRRLCVMFERCNGTVERTMISNTSYPNRSLLYLGDIIKYLCNVCCIFYCNNKIKSYNTSVLSIQELCELSIPNHFTYTLFPRLRSIFSTR
ncbi:hypothetical protein ALC57_09906, partial [Trachymyrmex cornetzi]